VHVFNGQCSKTVILWNFLKYNMLNMILFALHLFENEFSCNFTVNFSKVLE